MGGNPKTERKTKKGVQQFMLGRVLNSEKRARETLAAVKAAGYDGLELCAFMVRPTSIAVRAITRLSGMPVGKGGKLDWPQLMAEAGLETLSFHTDFGTLGKDPGKSIREARRLGTDRIVITAAYGYPYGDETQVHALAESLNALGRELRGEGISLLYHNHNVELARLPSGRRAYDILIDGTDPDAVNFEFDSYWFAEGGADPLFWMGRLGARMKMWHVNDRGARLKGKPMTPILSSDSMELGTGNMPLDALFERALSLGVCAAVLESHRNWIGGSPVESLKKSAEFMNKKIP